MFLSVIKNLWYSYVSRKMWETGNTDCFGNKVSYSFIDFPEFRFRVMPFFLCTWAVLGTLICDLTTHIGRFLLFGVIMAVPYEVCFLVDYLIQKSKPRALFYAKKRLGVMQGKNNEYKVEEPSKESCCFLTQRARNINIYDVRFCLFGNGTEDGKNSLTVSIVADGKNILKGTSKTGERKGIQENIVDTVKNDGTKQIYTDTGKKDGGFFEIAGCMETPALEGAFTTSKEWLSNDDCYTCNFKNGKCGLISFTKCYLSGWFVKDSKGNNVSEFVDCSCQGDRKKCAQQKIYDFLGILQDDHLWAEYNCFERVLLFLTSPLWVPMALINGGFRAADPYKKEERLRSFFEEVYFFSFMSVVCILIIMLFML